MDDRPYREIADAADALETARANPAQDHNADELIITLADLATIAALLGQLAHRARRQLAAWAAVGPYLHQAEQHAGDLSRSLHHACATLAFANPPSTAA